MIQGEVMASSSIGSHISHVSLWIRPQYSVLSTQYSVLSTHYIVLILTLETGATTTGTPDCGHVLDCSNKPDGYYADDYNCRKYWHCYQAHSIFQRDGEYKKRSHLRGFCHYPHREVDAGRHGCKTTEYKSIDSPLPLLLNVMYCVRVSLWTVKIFLAQH